MKTLLMLFLLGLIVAKAEGAMVKVGDAAPDVAAPGTNDKDIRLSDYRGSWVVLFFYPKAFTPGCTAEACSLRDGYAEIEKLGAVILGASLDSVQRQKEFKAKHNMPFELIADADKVYAQAFDVLAMGGLMAQRKTFIIDPQGRIAYVFDKVTTGSHNQEVADVLKKLALPK